MKKLLQLITLLVFSLFLGSCEDLTTIYDSDKMVFNERDFEALEISDLAGNVIIQKSTGFDIVARGRTQDLGDLKVENVNRKLKIFYKNQRSNRRMVRLEISMPSLNSVHFSGAVKGKAEGEFETEKFKIELHGTSDFNSSIRANEISSQIHGSSVLTLTSSTTIGLHTTQVFGTSRVEAYDLPTRSTYIQAFGASKGYVSVSHDFIASADGVSKIRYIGEPKNLTVKTSGLSTISKK